MVINSRYSQEFNRTIPHQTEGPEFSPYLNTGTTATKPTAKKSSALLAAMMAAAALAALLLPLCFSIKNVQTTTAELHFAVVAEEGYTEDDMLTYQLLFRGEIVEEGLLPFGRSLFLLDNLMPDSRYTVEIFKNGEPEKTLNFRTKPVGNEETTVPATEPPATQAAATEPTATQAPPVTQATIPATTAPTQPTVTTAPTEATTPVRPTPPYVPPATPPEDIPPEAIPDETINPYHEPSFEPHATANNINSQMQIVFNLVENMASDITYTVEHTVNGVTVGTHQYPGSAESATINIPADCQTSTNTFTVTISYNVDGIPGSKTQVCTVVPPNLLPGISGTPTFTLDSTGTQLSITGTIDPNGADPDTISIYIATGYSSVFPYYDKATYAFYTGDKPISLSVVDQMASSLNLEITIISEVAGVTQSVTSPYTFTKPVSP